MASRLCLALAFSLACTAAGLAQEPKLDTSRGDKMLAEYFALETKKLQENCLAEIETLDDWNAKKGEYRRQLLEMLGLDPLPEKTDLKPVITGKVEHEEFVVENLHFQSRPGLYVTGNLYVPKKIEKPLPTILYVCGHGAVKKDGVSYGNKVTYQHHGAWFARNGYVCLTIDTLQLGEIEGIHHGTHRYGMWWWLNRGYTPAGVEAWNCVRALDYLETRPEVDKTKFGVTGRSGGGAYSWWIAAIDDRIQCAVPVAGITDLQNHVVDGCVEGHCDCMFMLNTYRWDYPLVAALVAPRPLLVANTDSDRIFPLDGVYRTFEEVRRIYRLHEAAETGATAKIALNITAGPHKDTQELQTHAFRWFNIHLKGDDAPIDSRAPKYFEPEQLKVFAVPSTKAPTSGRGDSRNDDDPPRTLTSGQGFEGQRLGWPADQKNTEIHETFVAAAPPAEVPRDKGEWERFQKEWKQALIEKSFRGLLALDFPRDPFAEPKPYFANPKPSVFHGSGMTLAIHNVNADRGAIFPLFVLQRADLAKPELVVLRVLDSTTQKQFQNVWNQFSAESQPDLVDQDVKEDWERTRRILMDNPWAMAYVMPRGVSDVDPASKKEVQIRRRYYLLGQTLESMQFHDVRRAILGLRMTDDLKDVPLRLKSHGRMAGVTLYASLFEPDIERLELYDLPKTHRDGPYFLNVSRYLDMPQAVAMAAERAEVVLYQDGASGWEYPQAVAKALGWDSKQLQIREKPAN